MKALLAAIALTLASAAGAADMKGMDMKDMPMKDMPMKDMAPTRMHKDDKSRKHTTKGVVKKIDAKAGTVTLDHEPVKSLDWPAMTMAFKVKDKALMKKFETAKQTEVEFEKRGKDYVITGVK